MPKGSPYLSPDDIRTRINRDGVAHGHFERLKREGSDEGVLLGMLLNLGNYSPGWDALEVTTDGLDRRQVRAAAKKIREAADLMRRTRWLLFSKKLTRKEEAALEGWEPGGKPLLLPEDLDEFRGLPKRVLEFAENLERAASRPEFLANAPTIWNSALCMLMVYLKESTGRYQDSAVCELLRAATGITKNETALILWRRRQKEALLHCKFNFKRRPAT